MTKQEKEIFYNIIKQGLERRYPIIVKAMSELGLQESQVDSKIADAIAILKGDNLPEAQDTLKELADLIVANQGGITETRVTEIVDGKTRTDEQITALAKAYHDANVETIVVPTQAEVDTIFGV